MPHFGPVNFWILECDFSSLKEERARIAGEVVESLVLISLLGMNSHRVVGTRNCFNSIDAGAIDPNAEPFLRDNGVEGLIHGRQAFGQIVAKKAVKAGIALVKHNGEVQ